ncbi:MAG: hypothetical protein QOD81_1516 [Solirubrobacteraceae bacterium]|nr:hypothetical protein [Solirubrobacteraceae bacterium]
MQVTTTPDRLSATTVQYTASKKEWRVGGHPAAHPERQSAGGSHLSPALLRAGRARRPGPYTSSR